MEDEQDESQVNFIPCICIVKRGVAKENPEKVTLTQEELAKVISETKRELDGDDDDDDDDDNNREMETSDTEQSTRPVRPTTATNREDDEFNFADYDNEEATQVAGIGDIAVIDPEDRLEDEEDSEAEDDIIKPTDNLVVVGHVDDDAASLEVFIYNEEEGSFYVHHDFLLPSYPLCIEWMHYDPETKEPGNMIAIGSMEPIITLWDLDIQDTLEPALKLGAKRNRKKNIEAFGHTDAVLDLSWNTNFPHILASGSVDQTVILWDVDEGKPHTTITAFQEKVQTIKFHADEAHSLLTGSCDGTVRLFDCRDPDTLSQSQKIWNFGGEIERVAWDPFDANFFFASNNSGKIYYVDVRQDDRKVWSKRAHDQEVTGLTLNASCRGMLTTTSADGQLKVWKFDGDGANLVYSEETKIGRIQCMDVSTDNSFTVAVGGDNKRKNLRVINLRDYETVQRAFGLNL